MLKSKMLKYVKNAFSYSFETLLHLTKTFMGLTSVPLLLMPTFSCAGSSTSPQLILRLIMKLSALIIFFSLFFDCALCLSPALRSPPTPLICAHPRYFFRL